MLEGIPGDHLVRPLVLQSVLHRWLFLALEFVHLSSPCQAVSLCSFPQCWFMCLSIRCCPSSIRQWNKILSLPFQLWADRGTNFSSLRVELPVRQVTIFQRGSAEVQRVVSTLHQEEVGLGEKREGGDTTAAAAGVARISLPGNPRFEAGTRNSVATATSEAAQTLGELGARQEVWELSKHQP